MLYGRGDRPTAVFFSRKDPAIIIPMFVMAGALVWAVNEIRAGRESLITLGVLLVVTFYIWITLSTRYEIREDELVASSAIFRWRIPLNAIVEAFAARGWAPAAPALSRNRLQINYVHHSGAIASLRVSPEDDDEFVGVLKQAVKEAKEQLGSVESSGSIHGSYMGPAPEDRKIRF